ncbi:MAG TPA: gfo/Idh/MocA family oxidoreductase [Verrucomicrobia bacterium]|nr:MAG: hypothetical protein A2X46_10505 [Lentisphaerae bacterium GWF2_57_35]HBA84331.1 gfo/Idh/MocA family oxidoreductase [Verrucomicrobiota bacterium]
MNERIKVISIGGGWVVNNRHIPSLLKNPNFELIGVVSNEPERARRTAEKFGMKNYATETDLSSGWQSEADAVVIGTVPHAHYEIACSALEHGKHVLTEKPMVIDPAQGRDLRDRALAKKLTLAVVHNFQFARASHRFRQDFESGRIGKIQAIYGVQLCNHARNIPGWCDELPLGLFFDEAPHFYYLFRWLAGGDIDLLNASVWKAPGKRNTPRMVTGEYRSKDNYPVYLHINFASSLTEWHVTIVGDKGTADIDVWRDIYVYLPNDGVHTAKDILRTSLYSSGQHLWGVLTGGLRYAAGKHLYGNPDVQDRFCRAIRGEDSLKGMNADEGIRVVEMMHELIQRATMH